MSEAIASWRRASAAIFTLALTLASAGRVCAQQPPPVRPAPAPPAGPGAVAPAPAGAAPAAAANPAAPAGWAEIRIIPKTEIADLKEWDNKKFKLAGWVRSQQHNSPEFRDYFEVYFLPQFTQEGNLERAPALRKELAEAFLTSERMRNPVAREALNEIVLAYMLAVVHSPVRVNQKLDVIWNGDARSPRYWRLNGNVSKEGNKNVYSRGEITVPGLKREPPKQRIHPSCLYNAMLVIGELNESVKLERGVVTAETPWPRALKALVDSASNDTLPEAVRLAAMIGIQRHIDKSSEQLGDPARDMICAAMVRVIKERPGEAGRFSKGQLWIRRQAVSLIGACRREGQNQAYRRALVDRLTDPNEPPSLRQEAAAALAFVQPAKQKPEEVVEMAKGLAELVMYMVNDELSPTPKEQTQFSRRRIGDGLDCVVLALGGTSGRVPPAVEGQPAPPALGILPGATGNEKAFVQGLIDRVSELRNACATLKEPKNEAELRDKLSNGIVGIEEFVSAGPEKAAAAQHSDIPMPTPMPKPGGDTFGQ